MAKKTCIFLVSILLCFSMIASSFATSLLPTKNELFGEVMPTFRKILMRDPDASEALEDGSKVVTFYQVTESEYDSFGVYLNEFGCTLLEYELNDTAITAILEKNGHSFTFTYDFADGTAVLSYPTDTSEETFDVAAAAREPFTQVGNIVTYGHYEQDNDTSNGEEAIEWIVIKYDSANGRALLLSLYGLDNHRFDESTYQGWAMSEIRTWLNNDFMNAAFTETEQAEIETTTVKTGNNAEWVAIAKTNNGSYTSMDGGADTQDKIFLLSLEEALEFGGYSSIQDSWDNRTDLLKAIPTKYAVAHGANQSSSNTLNGEGCCCWWLRSPGSLSSLVSLVYYDGSLNHIDMSRVTVAVRPAFWLNLQSEVLQVGEEASTVVEGFEVFQNDKGADFSAAEEEEHETIEPSSTNVNVGDYITFGHYEQDNNTSNGKEAIEWLVLDVQDDKALVISKYGLDDHRFDTRNYHGWDKSEIRKWLNSTFLNAAFTPEEQEAIVTTKISTPDYHGYSGGSDTQDKIWLLSRDEATTYFKNDEARKAVPTKYAVAQGVYQSSRNTLNGEGCCLWWLRSPGDFRHSASYVTPDGGILGYDGVSYSSVVDRPAFWLDLNSAAIY